jgi:hypothetical protein
VRVAWEDIRTPSGHNSSNHASVLRAPYRLHSLLVQICALVTRPAGSSTH